LAEKDIARLQRSQRFVGYPLALKFMCHVT
jgi:hypothetical protein